MVLADVNTKRYIYQQIVKDTLNYCFCSTTLVPFAEVLLQMNWLWKGILIEALFQLFCDNKADDDTLVKCSNFALSNSRKDNLLEDALSHGTQNCTSCLYAVAIWILLQPRNSNSLLSSIFLRKDTSFKVFLLNFDIAFRQIDEI